MKEIKIDELRIIQLEMIEYIDKLCRVEEIDYSISAGSLLGAVKYSGYIPWDDDIDIMLTRPNYDRLIEAFSKDINKPEFFSVLHYSVQESFLPMAKLYNNRTFFSSHRDQLNKEMGVFIDIFPIDVLPNDPEEGEKFKHEIRQLVTKLTASRPGLAYASSEKWLYVFAKSLLWLPQHLKYQGKTSELSAQVDQMMQKYSQTDNKYCNYVFSPPKRTGYFERSIFNEYEDVAFEHLTLRKIKRHAPYLRELYGNYNQEPRDREKRNHSYYKWYWKD